MWLQHEEDAIHKQDERQRQHGQGEADTQARQVTSPDIGPGRNSGRHHQFVYAQLAITCYKVGYKKGRKQTPTTTRPAQRRAQCRES